MVKVGSEHTTARRHVLLAGVACLPAPAGIAAPVRQPEARLEWLGARAAALQVAYDSTFVCGLCREAAYSYDERMEPVRARLYDEQDEIARAMASLPSETLGGVLAKARAALAMAYKDADGDVVVEDNSEMLAWCAIGDLVSLADGGRLG